MGETGSWLEKIQLLIIQIRNEIPVNNFFELGEDVKKLDKIDDQLSKLYELLNSFSNNYSTVPLGESNPYLEAIRITREAQQFIKNVRKNGKGSTDNARDFLELIQRLENIVLASHEAVVIETKEEILHNSISRGRPIKEVVSSNKTSANSGINTEQLATPNKSHANNFIPIINVMLFIPKIIGKFVFDIVRYQTPAESSSVIMGLIVIVAIISVINGIIQKDILIKMLQDAWNAFISTN